ncbi:MAG TPA: PRC-barrel domain-containing protein [Thermomicrobiales bacterium]|nr:PRC-barrel domain-containing protein [Thermomicrobiales bacterium]
MDTMTLKDLQGMAVISIEDGTKVGSISRVYVDPAEKRVVGISVDPGSSLIEVDSTKLIDVSDIHSLGPDALTIVDVSQIEGNETNARWMDLLDMDRMTNDKVVTEGGEQVGGVAAVRFNPRDFMLTGIEVSPGFFKTNKFVPIDQVITIGPDMMIVSNAVCEPAGATDMDAAQPAGEDEEEFGTRLYAPLSDESTPESTVG